MHILPNACSILYCWWADWCWHIQERQSLVLDFIRWIFYVATLKRKPANFFLSLWKLLDDSQGHCQFFFWLFELGMLARTYLESSPSCHHWQCEFPTSKQKSELSKSGQKTSRCWRQHVRISTWWPAMSIILFAIPTLYSHVSDYNMFNCFPRLYSGLHAALSPHQLISCMQSVLNVSVHGL